ncbi:MAG: DUF1330 domain-containing protein [Burkholderiales bacterium]|nr:DUF1330 domain-containing protein [Burkholderiales bacterium]
MTAYIHGNIEVTDPVAYEEYRRQVPAIIAAYGGRYLVRGGSTEVLEGDVQPLRQVILEFPDLAAAKAFYTSPEYRPLIAIRQRAARGSLVAIDGLPPGAPEGQWPVKAA